jgi:hypothetical protein
MDSKIIAAIILAVGFVAGVYIYTQDNAYNRCLNAYDIKKSDNNELLKSICMSEQEKFKH